MSGGQGEVLLVGAVYTLEELKNKAVTIITRTASRRHPNLSEGAKIYIIIEAVNGYYYTFLPIGDDYWRCLAGNRSKEDMVI